MSVNYWTINQGKTYKDEIPGGYAWAPITNKSGKKIQFYTNITFMKMNDIAFSLINNKKGLCIYAVGLVKSNYYKCKNPLTNNKEDWINEGWKIDIEWKVIEVNPIIKEHFQKIKPLLPEKYSPILKKNGNAPQQCYVSQISNELGNLFKELIGLQYNFNCHDEECILEEIKNDVTINETVKECLVKSRIGQGRFRKNVLEIEPACRITGLCIPELLIASHIKPWKMSNNYERLDENNGLMLTPTIDKLFDKGFISFTDEGNILYCKIHPLDLTKLGLDIAKNVGKFNKEQLLYLDYHRKNVFNK